MDLAIIIPAYKITYLDEALSSLSKQTNKNFTVYVGDDCSPHDIESVCLQYKDDIPIRYHRFDTNLGGTNLVKQWERCVDLINDEQWIWLFSDDDIAEKDCVSQFYQALELTDTYYDVYRFNTCVINASGEIIGAADESPLTENAMVLALNILLGKRGNCMPDQIFKRTEYVALKGFVDFDFGQSSDWATSINYSYNKGLYTIAGPKVRWRYSGDNISSLAIKNKHAFAGYLQFLQWTTQRFTSADEQKFGVELTTLRAAIIQNFKTLVKTHYGGIPYTNLFKVALELSTIFKMSYLETFGMCLLLNLRADKRRLKKVIKKLTNH